MLCQSFPKKPGLLELLIPLVASGGTGIMGCEVVSPSMAGVLGGTCFLGFGLPVFACGLASAVVVVVAVVGFRMIVIVLFVVVAGSGVVVALGSITVSGVEVVTPRTDPPLLLLAMLGLGKVCNKATQLLPDAATTA